MADGGTGDRRVRVRVEGIVQGVGFRQWVAQTAGGMGLAGWVRNRRDATVEAVFAGPAELVGEMVGRCRTGPSSARISAVTVLEEGVRLPPDGGSEFRVLPTV